MGEREILSFPFDIHDTLFSEFHELEQQIYANDPIWTPLTKQDLATLIETRTAPGEIICYLYKRENRARSRMITIADLDLEVMYFSFFEALDRDSAHTLITHILQVAKERKCNKLVGPRLSNLYLGLLIEGFDKTQTIFTVYNQDWYRDIFDELGFKQQQKYLTYMFDRTINFDALLMLLGNRIPADIETRNLDLTQLDRELRIFNKMNQVFLDRDLYDQRTTSDDQSLVQSILPIIDPQLIVIAESKETGNAVGMVICLPDTYPAKRDEEIFGVRFVSIAVLPEWQNRGVALAMIRHLARILLPQEKVRYLEASFIMEENSVPISIAKKFGAKPGRTFEILEKEL